MTSPKCKLCGFLEIDRYTRGERGHCYCNHPHALETFKASGQTRAACFIGFTGTRNLVPTIKTSPRWCPLRVTDEKEKHNGKTHSVQHRNGAGDP